MIINATSIGLNNDDEIKSSIHEKSNSFFREILNIYDNETIYN